MTCVAADLNGMAGAAGGSPAGSLMKVLEKKLFRIPAMSLSWSTISPSGVLKGPTVERVLVFCSESDKKLTTVYI